MLLCNDPLGVGMDSHTQWIFFHMDNNHSL